MWKKIEREKKKKKKNRYRPAGNEWEGGGMIQWLPPGWYWSSAAQGKERHHFKRVVDQGQ